MNPNYCYLIYIKKPTPSDNLAGTVLAFLFFRDLRACLIQKYSQYKEESNCRLVREETILSGQYRAFGEQKQQVEEAKLEG